MDMGRRKTISDEALLDALMQAISVHGPDGLTFAAAASAVELSPATLVQRFGSRDEMVEAILLRAWDRLDAATSIAANAAAPGPAGAVELLMRLMPAESADYDMTDGLLLLREDVRIPMLRARGKAWGEALTAAIAQRLSSDPRDGVRLAWQMLRVWQGTLFWWAFTREGPPQIAIRAALEDWCASVGLAL